MVIDDAGRAYVGSQAREGGVIVRVDPDDTATVVAENLDFPNGMVITPDRTTLIVAESIGRRLTAFTHRARTDRCPIEGSSPKGSTDHPTASAWTPRAGYGCR